MSFLKSLFGGSKDEAPKLKDEHEGFTIAAFPMAEGGGFLVAGTITKEIAGEVKEHRFVRADRFPSVDEAAEASINKGRQIIDLKGERIFN